MTTSLRRLLGSLIIVLGGLALIAPARGADAVIDYQLPSPDPSGIAAQTAPGIGGCTAGCATLRLLPGALVPARRQGLLSFSAPSGTTIASATVRLRYRTKQAAVSAHLQSRIGGRWIDGQRLRSSGGTTATVSAGRGATAVGVALTADSAVPAKLIRNEADNSVTVESVQLTVRDLSAPTVAWAGVDPTGGEWQRGALCGTFAARDAGLGVDHVELALGAVVSSAASPAGTRLQPRPPTFDGTVCVDTAQVGDGTFGTALTAVDTGANGNRSTPVAGVVRIDNTAPTVTYTPATDPEARLPVCQLVVADATSGVDHVVAAVDGLPASVHTVNGITAVTPSTPLSDGTHRLTWEAGDVAGNIVTGSEAFGVADATPPTIDDTQPVGVASPAAVVSAHAFDNGAGLSLDGWRLAIDGVDVTGAADVSANGGISYAPLRPWTEGEHSARVTAVDRSGNRTTRAWTFSLPLTPAVQPVVPVAAADLVMPAQDALTPSPVDNAGNASAAAYKLTLCSSRQRLRTGAEVRLLGRVTGSAPHRVRIEARVGRSWRTVVVVAVNATGRFSTPVRLPTAGGYDVRARAGAMTSSVVHLIAR